MGWIDGEISASIMRGMCFRGRDDCVVSDGMTRHGVERVRFPAFIP